jgi:hypothetical protein
MSEVKGTMSVGVTDAMSSAIGDALARIKLVPESKTLVATISEADWNSWDASEECALVCDHSSMNGDDQDEGTSLIAA